MSQSAVRNIVRGATTHFDGTELSVELLKHHASIFGAVGCGPTQSLAAGALVASIAKALKHESRMLGCTLGPAGRNSEAK